MFRKASRRQFLQTSTLAATGYWAAGRVAADSSSTDEFLSTDNMGGVVITPGQLKEMQAGDYILHAHDGQLKKVAAEKIRLPLDPQGHYQGLSLALAPDGTIYATQKTIISKSTDGGKTWNHLKRDASTSGFSGWLLQVDKAGTLLNVSQPAAEEPVRVWASDDDGETWEQLCEIDAAPFMKTTVGASMTRLDDGTLLLPIKRSDEPFYEGTNPMYVFRSHDGGRTFPHHSFLSDYGCETNIAELSPGRLLAVVRYQPGPPEQPHTNKTTFLADSVDGGRTWKNLRQLTSVRGQCHGAAVGLSNDRVVVAHDHRYPRDLGSCRAMVSHDHGQKWKDEVYYLCHGNVAGYPRHVTLDQEEILTFVGSCYGDVSKWENAIGKSHFSIIRWRPV